jgi:hypothetical protein
MIFLVEISFIRSEMLTARSNANCKTPFISSSSALAKKYLRVHIDIVQFMYVAHKFPISEVSLEFYYSFSLSSQLLMLPYFIFSKVTLKTIHNIMANGIEIIIANIGFVKCNLSTINITTTKRNDHQRLHP